MFPNVLASMPVVVPEPFPHVVVPNALPDHIYARMEYEFPALPNFFNAHKVANNKRIDLSSKFLDERFSPVWKAFIQEHVGQRFWATLWDIFGASIRREFPERNVDPNGSVTTRWSHTKSEFTLDCALGINTPVVVKGSVRGPHVDKPGKMIAGLFYLPLEGDTAGGDLILYKTVGTPQFEAKSQVVNAAESLAEAVRVPYRRNTAVFYLNTPRSIHGVTEREVTPLCRRLVAFACGWREPMFKTR